MINRNNPYDNQSYLNLPGESTSPGRQTSQGNRGAPQQETERRGGAQDSTTGVLPSISVPKGGGAIKGIDEKFSVNPATGTGSMSIPLPVSPGRYNFQPQLALSYNSGAGNGPFGLGWDLSMPNITRKTDKGLPKYQDQAESDVLILSGAEDLVPALKVEDGEWRKDIRPSGEYHIQRYRPRIEGLFARIEKWTRVTGNTDENGEVHWRATTKENVTSIYGRSEHARIADPDDPSHVFSWLLEETYDDKGNAIVYEYKQENQEDIVPTPPQEGKRLRLNKSFAKRYLKRVRYGNKNPYYPPEHEIRDQDWLFLRSFLIMESMLAQIHIQNLALGMFARIRFQAIAQGLKCEPTGPVAGF